MEQSTPLYKRVTEIVMNIAVAIKTSRATSCSFEEVMSSEIYNKAIEPLGSILHEVQAYNGHRILEEMYRRAGFRPSGGIPELLRGFVGKQRDHFEWHSKSTVDSQLLNTGESHCKELLTICNTFEWSVMQEIETFKKDRLELLV